MYKISIFLFSIFVFDNIECVRISNLGFYVFLYACGRFALASTGPPLEFDIDGIAGKVLKNNKCAFCIKVVVFISCVCVTMF